MNILVLVGSTRPGSFNAQLAKPAVESLPEGWSASIHPGLDQLPFYSEPAEHAELPANVVALREAVANADAVVVATPEYNGNPAPVVTNAIAWASRPYGEAALTGKRAAVIGASASPHAAARARTGAVMALRVAGATVTEETVGLASGYDKMIDGVLEVDQDTREELRGLLMTLDANAAVHA